MWVDSARRSLRRLALFGGLALLGCDDSPGSAGGADGGARAEAGACADFGPCSPCPSLPGDASALSCPDASASPHDDAGAEICAPVVAPLLPVGPGAAAAEAVVAAQCAEQVGEARVREVAPGVWLASGFDLANTIAVVTSEGLVVVDVGMTPERAAEVRAAIEAVAPGPVAAVIYTHSHIDHVGGATAWVDDETPIWASHRFVEHFVKQYGAFNRAESVRGARQFGVHVEGADLPCSAIGRRADVQGAQSTGAVLPNRVVHAQETLRIGDTELVLVEAPGETEDQLFVWLPSQRVLLVGDNYYSAFPNLYTIRGTSARPVNAWIRSLDAMRALRAAVLVPSHTQPVLGEAAVAEALTAYRDAIQWVRDEVVRGANAGLGLDALAEGIRLPAHLAERPDLAELYGEVSWSARAIYGANLGWFDGETAALYPPRERAAREVALMGGPEHLHGLARAAAAEDPRWAGHLLGKVRAAGHPVDAALEAEVWRTLAAATPNTNGRAWLHEVAAELEGHTRPPGPSTLNPRLLAELPVEVVFEVLPGRLKVEATREVEASLLVRFPETQFTITVRRGVAEVIEGAPLPGTPPPSATLTTDPHTWKRLTIAGEPPAPLVLEGLLQIDDLVAATRFLAYFDSQGLGGAR